jgi:hypothetical protein
MIAAAGEKAGMRFLGILCRAIHTHATGLKSRSALRLTHYQIGQYQGSDVSDSPQFPERTNGQTSRSRRQICASTQVPDNRALSHAQMSLSRALPSVCADGAKLILATNPVAITADIPASPDHPAADNRGASVDQKM